MNNIFEGAKFGDKFVCRNGQKAVLLSYELKTAEHTDVIRDAICLCTEDGYIDSHYNLDGTLPYDNVSEYEIVSRYQKKKIDIDKACEWLKDNARFEQENGKWVFDIDGFRKAMYEE